MDPALLDDFQRAAGDLAADEVALAALVARLLDPSVDARALEARVAALSAGRAGSDPPWTYLHAAGFQGDVDTYQSLDNSNLAQVLERRRGIPITLGVLLIRLARDSGRRAVGLNFPGHFLVAVDDLVVDPFVFEVRDHDELVARLPAQARARPREELFAPCRPVGVAMRMLNNVRLTHARNGAWDRALQVVDAQLELAPEHPALYLEQGDLWRRLGAVAGARLAFERALAYAESSGQEELSALARNRLEALGGGGDVIH
ncbi:MAG: transglutaminase family protein [Pseudomonadota bacterium]